MNKLYSAVQACVRLAALTLCLVISATAAMAGDRVTLKDGRVLEGELVREMDGYVWLKYTVAGLEKTDFFAPNEIEKLERDAAAAPVGDAPVVATVPPVVARPGVPKAMIITLGDEENGDMVGVYMTAEQLKKAIPYLEQELGKDGQGIVVFRIHSGGGLALEVQRLSDVIHNEYKPRFRTVAWIDTAISAAAMTAHCLEEIYFTSQGNYGACTMFSGALVAAKGRSLEDALVLMEKISARGGYDPLIMRAMQIQQPLSATIDADGIVHYYGDTTSGDFIVNRENEILTFNAITAAKVCLLYTSDAADE